MHILMKEGVALEESPNFVNWCDRESEDFMFTTKQEESWSNAHLKLFEMPKDETPLHKELNRRVADPAYEWSNVGGPPQPSTQDAPASQGTSRTSKAIVKGSTTKGVVPKTNVALKETKREALTARRKVTKRGKVVDASIDETNVPTKVDGSAAISEAKSSKSNSHSRPSQGSLFLQRIRQTLATREMSSKPMESLILNECFTNFMEVESS